MIVALAVLVSVPIGLLTAIYLAQARTASLAGAVRFCAKVLTGFPSILAGCLRLRRGRAGDRRLLGAGRRGGAVDPDAADDHPDGRRRDLRMVPARMSDAAIGMGATSTQIVWMVLLPTAMPGILTGVMLASRAPPAKRRRCCSRRCSATTGCGRAATST